MSSNEIIGRINAVLAEEFEVDPAVITPEAPLMETLEMDSLDLVDVVVLVEQTLGITLKGHDFVGMKTFEDFYNLLIGRMNGHGEA